VYAFKGSWLTEIRYKTCVVILQKSQFPKVLVGNNNHESELGNSQEVVQESA
jgi:hypothetical protein